ncbi:MAG: dihydropyrimidinase [Candidatus Marinimicrobia bacterium]|jgi:dihydropyrimidinase|nr:dihydropyrimidinase [Candidatus Neomarinimicrobiota bacterium]MBT3937454.1 dihydropyrimidinase [Candidatus Neomarinimicrobiota bacterium]MBT3961310.1 dihydropyrimidinase [Candidatus Neomarinimicrobiota bacterium]MBT4383105.1 dihydropyrimidinase [Candidatus Neomarinimicrobiota bacterium]MBT4635575.1 dihydropyrimidinase [Candidatus Neomarinimicrobiota bacterium]
MSILIKNGRVITAVDDYMADVFIENETVTLIGNNLEMEADEVIDASGKYLFPGGLDPHTHLDMPFGGTTSADDFETGTRAAAHGGTTTVIDFAIQSKGHSTLEALDIWHAKADGKTAIDYGFHMIVTDLEDSRIHEMKMLADVGVTSYKLFMAYPGVLYVDDGTIYRAMKKAGEDGTVVCMHAENGIVIDEIVKQAVADGKTAPKYHAITRPTRMEAEGVHRAISIAEVAQVPIYIVHLSSSDALEQVMLARNRGVHAFAETCPQYLFLDDSYYNQKGFEGAKYVMTPALREKWNQDELWKGLKFGDLQSIATDHCPFCFKDQKILGIDDFSKIPNGAPGVENRMSLVYNGGVHAGRISLNKFVELTSTAAAKTFGLFPKKGTIAVGSDADIVVFDPNRKETISVNNTCTHHMNVDYNSYEGFEVTGFTETVLSRGKIIIDNCAYVGKKGDGRFLKRGLYGGMK